MGSPHSNHRSPLISAIAAYWDDHIHDLSVAKHPAGTRDFFQELDDYRFDKLRYLPRLIHFADYQGGNLLEVGCGIGIDLVHFARAGASVSGVDVSRVAIELARANFEMNRLPADLYVMNGEALAFQDGSFDVVYAHGVLQYTADPAKMMAEIHRVLKPGGAAILMVYNKYSWLNLLARLSKVHLEHEDAPVQHKFSVGDLKRMAQAFTSIRIIPERFPVKTRLHTGWKARVYNAFFVALFNLFPRPLVRPFGWHLMAFAVKGS